MKKEAYSAPERLSDIIPTTMVLVYRFEGTINLIPTFNLLPVSRIDNIVKSSRAKKSKLYHPGIAGVILSIRIQPEKDGPCMTRGLLRSEKAFNHCITVDMTIEEKYVSIKLSNHKVHITGTNSNEDGTEAYNWIMSHMEYTQTLLDYVKSHTSELEEARVWITDLIRGESQERSVPTGQYLMKSEKRVPIMKVVQNHPIVIPDSLDIPDHLDKDCVRWLTMYIRDRSFVEDYDSFINHIVTTDNIRLFEGQLDCPEMNHALVNYKFTLGHKVSRTMICDIFEGTEFQGTFLKNFHNHAKIKRPIDDSELEGYIPQSWIDKKKGLHKNSFAIYRSGIVTMSGICDIVMERDYRKFIDVCRNNRSLIESQEYLENTPEQEG